MGQGGIGVGNDVFKPGPLFGRVGLKKVDQPVGQRVAHLRGHPVAVESAEIFVDAEQRVGPGAGRRGVVDGRKRPLEQLGRPGLEVPML